MEFKLTLSMDNAAFTEAGGYAPELARILEKAADQARAGRDAAPIIDVNGNRVGSWEVIP